MLFTPDSNKQANHIDHTIKPLFNTNYDKETILASSRYTYSKKILSDLYDNINIPFGITYNTSRNVRLTLTPQALRSNKYDFSNGQFDSGYPESANYPLCNQRLSSIINYGNSSYTSFFNELLSYPKNNTFGLVKDLKLSSNECGSCAVVDHITGLCVSPPKCIPVEPVIITIPPNLKTTIKGYAFYLDTIREVNVPDIGLRQVSCAGGHRCCRTNFIPKIITPEGMYVGEEFDMNNYNNCTSQSTPVDGFVPYTAGERSASFTINIPNINDEINDALFLLNCNSEEGCHNGVTMIFLVAEDADTDESYLIFASCVAVGCTDPVPLGSIVDSEVDPADCVPTSTPEPVLNCDELKFKIEGCQFPTSGPAVNNPDALALANYINSILNSTLIITAAFDINGNFNNQATGSQIIAGYGEVFYELQVNRSISSTSMTLTFSSANVINGTTTIFSAGVNIPNPPLNPYDIVTDVATVFAGWFANAFNPYYDENEELVEPDCEFNMILNPIP
jgi:hypothetical protein